MRHRRAVSLLEDAFDSHLFHSFRFLLLQLSTFSQFVREVFTFSSNIDGDMQFFDDEHLISFHSVDFDFSFYENKIYKYHCAMQDLRCLSFSPHFIGIYEAPIRFYMFGIYCAAFGSLDHK